MGVTQQQKRVDTLKMNSVKREGEFTLFEMLVVIAIMGILFGIGGITLTNLRNPAQEGQSLTSAALEQLTKERDTFSCLSGSRKYRVRAVGDGVTEVHLFHRSTGNCSKSRASAGHCEYQCVPDDGHG